MAIATSGSFNNYLNIIYFYPIGIFIAEESLDFPIIKNFLNSFSNKIRYFQHHHNNLL